MFLGRAKGADGGSEERDDEPHSHGVEFDRQGAIGRLAAGLAGQGRWIDPLPSHLFAAQWTS